MGTVSGHPPLEGWQAGGPQGQLSWVAAKLHWFGPILWAPWSVCLRVIGRMFVAWIMLALFMHFQPKYTYTYLDQHLCNSLDKHPILVLARAFISFLCRIWRSKMVRNKRQQSCNKVRAHDLCRVIDISLYSVIFFTTSRESNHQ
jgi:hypothetical protein